MIENYSPVSLALFGGGITFAFTALGSALVFFFMSEIKPKLLATMYGFAAGVMTAASFWSLLAPSIELSENTNLPNWLIPVAGFLLGAFFIWVLDKVMPHMHIVNGNEETEGAKVQLSKSILLFLAITLHNIPEGLAVGVTFGAFSVGDSGVTFNAALALGIGLQNFPEGAAVSLPLKTTGVSKLKSFSLGAISGIVEPIAAVIGALAVTKLTVILPIALAFSAGAMMYVVIEELVPEAVAEEHNHFGVFGFIFGFAIMMVLDVALG
ncbi:ZIP family metal transporter [Brachyspira hyodysenteriae]|uniref:ZIP family metal transporter n=1 Tax=Brachyspira hyodysenteriae TaxID=159 RepID=UPI0022CDA447|nr:ZIP family metal transporter [Brachyspira hyodysenteriae]MCZ9891129.1 ZIP family metal transporter [Brachyspira hyodysenteriae]MCZ9988343.1 ZIP family metal transporter [Brachyspira hyodysenteriae]MCZ9997034.1 ZIP family metal transporter [Brachyspira hyodysenteriae]MDA0000473.1 ZIP family metal transporter [Brachyspira hyodysenteriae]MDA0005476.1 ZIP family metal transporter [Brachyspira hyodysenteriae]